MTNWQEVKLGELISIKHGYAFKGDDITTDDNGIVLVTPGNFAIGGGFQEEKCKFFKGIYPEDYVLKENDLIVTMTDLSKECDTLGYGALVPGGNRIYLHNQRIGLVEFKSQLISKNYLYWFMRTKKYQHFVVSSCSGSVIKHTSPSRICDAIIPLPPMDIQKKIAGVLSALDDKIELNNKINNNLEQQAQTLFKSWFVDFEPFGGVMPEDWKVGTFSEIIDDTIGGDWGKDEAQNNYTEEVYCIRGADIPDVKIGNKGKMPKRYILTKNYSSKKLRAGDLVIEISGGSPTQSTGRIAAISDYLLSRYDNKIICTNFCRALKPKLDYSEYIYHYWQYLYNKNVFFSYENGTTGIKNLDISGFLETEQISIPNQVVLKKFSELCDKFFKQIYFNGAENEKLSALRDALLPKLMSGEIDVSNVDISAFTSTDKLSFTEE